MHITTMKRKMLSGSLVVAACLLGSIVSMAAEPVKPLEQRPSTSAPPAGSFQSPPPQSGKPPATGTVGVPVVGTIRINVNQTGSAACPSSANTNIAVLDNIAGNKVKVTHNGQTTTYLPQASAITGLPLLRFDVQLCGQSNSFTYQVDGTSNILKRPLTFNITGSNGNDVVTFNFATKPGLGAASFVTMEKAPEVTLNLGNGADSVGIDVYNVGGGAMKVNARLGGNNDGFTFKSYPHTMAGSLNIAVEGEADNDQFNFILSDVNIPAGSNLTVRAAGDTLDQFFNVKDNVADHGMDRIWSGFSGEVDGTLAIQYYGDDTIPRAKDLQCGVAIPVCALYCFCTGAECDPVLLPGTPPICNAPTGLEARLQQVSTYANDLVQSRVVLRSGSAGQATVLVEGGLGSDRVALVVQNDNAVGALMGYNARLSGGQPHHFKTDTCYASNTHPQSSAYVVVEGCNQTDPSLGQF